MELLLYQRRSLISPTNDPLTEKEFINSAMNSAHDDKVKFFGKDHMKDGTWPIKMDRTHVLLAHEREARNR